MSKQTLIQRFLNQKVMLSTKGDALTDEIGMITDIQNDFVGFRVTAESHGEKKETYNMWLAIEEIAVITEMEEEGILKPIPIQSAKRLKQQSKN